MLSILGFLLTLPLCAQSDPHGWSGVQWGDSLATVKGHFKDAKDIHEEGQDG
jgi:hypothetical protein